MKIVASLLRPMVNVTADGDFCLKPVIDAAVTVPPIELSVSEIPLAVGGSVTVPDIRIGVSPIPINVSIGVVVLGIPLPSSTRVTGTLGGFSASVSLPAPIGFGMQGHLGGLTAAVNLPRPIAMHLDGCVQGVGRLNPRHLQVPECCEGFKEPHHCDHDHDGR